MVARLSVRGSMEPRSLRLQIESLSQTTFIRLKNRDTAAKVFLARNKYITITEMLEITMTQNAVPRLVAHFNLRFSQIFLDIECEANPMCAGFRTVLCGVFAES